MLSKEQVAELREELDTSLDELVTPSSSSEQPQLLSVVAGLTNRNENIYLGSKGIKSLKTNEKVDNDSIFALFSCTKTITTMGALILIERNQLKLSDFAADYLPLIDDLKLIQPNSIDRETGDFLSEPTKPKNRVTIKDLLLHTSGVSYAFMNADYAALTLKKNHHLSNLNPTLEFFSTIKTPLVHEPGTAWAYGHSVDLLGFIIQEITGLKLGDFLKKEIFDPVGMNLFTFEVDDTSNLIQVHKKKKGKFSILNGEPVPLKPHLHLGGQGCFGTIGDYMKFLRIWLARGYSPDSNKRILKTETVEFAIKNHLPQNVNVTFGEDIDKLLPADFEPDGFSLTGCAYSMNDFPTGRPKGALTWGGLANIFFWIDLKNDIAGCWGASILPKHNIDCLQNYFKFESLIYDALEDSKEITSKL